jgi:hypothetical protein
MESKYDPYAELFPEEFPDPIWNAHAKQLENQIKQLFDSGNLPIS